MLVRILWLCPALSHVHFEDGVTVALLRQVLWDGFYIPHLIAEFVLNVNSCFFPYFCPSHVMQSNSTYL